MKKSFKYSLLIILTLLIATSLVNAQSVPIGTTEQVQPYESNPTVTTTNTGFVFGAERDGDLSTSVTFQGVSTAGSGMVLMSQFTNTPPTPFTIGWVDLKIKYKHPGTGDDGFQIAYKTSGTTAWAFIQPTVGGALAKFDRVGIPAVRPWVDLATYPLTGAWTWTDVQNLQIRIMVFRGGYGWQALVDLYEVWLTIYESAPPASSTAMSVMPGSSNVSITGLQPGKFFFVDVYANGLTPPPGLWGYQATIKYDESVVTATEWFTYWPFTGDPGTSAITPGVASVSYQTFGGDTVGFTGTATPLCRIYFQVDSPGGATLLDLIDDRVNYISELKPVAASGYVPPLHDGWFSSPRYLSADPPVLIDLASPLTTLWHEEYPDYSKLWHLTSWEDVSPDNPLELGPSDQIDMTNETGWTYWFHVEEVTITIHWTLKEGEGGPLTEEIGKAEPEDPMLTMLPGDPTGTTWHMIYPEYCKTLVISSWTDTGEIGIFDPSDQFDFSYGAGDVLLIGPAPPNGAPLSPPGIGWQQILYWDVNNNFMWDVGESAWDDVDFMGQYDAFDTLLVGPAPPIGTWGGFPGLNDMFWDQDTNSWWDVGEPAIRDVDLSYTYNPAETFWAHLDAVSTDIIVTDKPIPPEYTGPWPEFPLGITLLLLIAPIIPLTYLWRLRKKVTKE